MTETPDPVPVPPAILRTRDPHTAGQLLAQIQQLYLQLQMLPVRQQRRTGQPGSAAAIRIEQEIKILADQYRALKEQKTTT